MYARVAGLPEYTKRVYEFIFDRIAIDGQTMCWNSVFQNIGLGSGVTSTSGINTTKMVDVAESLLAVMSGDFRFKPNLKKVVEGNPLF